jgi:hypothetical protein
MFVGDGDCEGEGGESRGNGVDGSGRRIRTVVEIVEFGTRIEVPGRMVDEVWLGGKFVGWR